MYRYAIEAEPQVQFSIDPNVANALAIKRGSHTCGT
jgi:hypothetical protein